MGSLRRNRGSIAWAVERCLPGNLAAAMLCRGPGRPPRPIILLDSARSACDLHGSRCRDDVHEDDLAPELLDEGRRFGPRQRCAVAGRPGHGVQRLAWLARQRFAFDFIANDLGRLKLRRPRTSKPRASSRPTHRLLPIYVTDDGGDTGRQSMERVS